MTKRGTDQARKYLAKLFSERIKRHDFKTYILNDLAGDFAHVLAEWLTRQSNSKGTLGATAEEVHPSLQEQREAICRAWNNLSEELRTSEALKPLWKAFQWSHEYVAELREKKLEQVIARPVDEVVSSAMYAAGTRAGREYFERTGGNDPAVIYRAMRAVALQEGSAK